MEESAEQSLLTISEISAQSLLTISAASAFTAKGKRDGVKKVRRKPSGQPPIVDFDTFELATSSEASGRSNQRMQNEFNSPKEQPFLEQIFEGISSLDSKHQDLMNKLSGMEQQITKVSSMQSSILAREASLLPGGRRSRGSLLSLDGVQKNEVSPAWQGDTDSSSKSNGYHTNGKIFIKVSVLLPGSSAWQCPQEATEASPESDMDRQNSRISKSASMSKTSSSKSFQGKILVHIRNARGLPKRDLLGNSDPYCMCAVSHDGVVQDRFSTRVLNDTCDPGWNEEQVFEGLSIGSTLHFNVKDKDIGIAKFDDDEPLGHCSLSWNQFYPQGFHGALSLQEGECAVSCDVGRSDKVSSGIDRLVRQLKEFEKRQDMVTQASIVRGMSGLQGMNDMSVDKKDVTLDVFMGILILVQTVFIGISMDYDFNYFIAFDILFLVSFMIEAYLKMRLHTIRQYFTRPWDVFNFILILLDITQMVVSSFATSDDGGDNLVSRLLRMIRFVRLGRLFRLCNLEVQFLSDLVAMLGGILGGTTTLISAVALFLVVVYITSLLFRELFGRQAVIMNCEECGDVDITEMFDNVPRSMLTVFRFFFGDFSTIQGVNLYEGIQIGYGTTAQLFVCLVFFVVFIGIFNVITGIFVESTVAAATKLDKSKLIMRLQNSNLWLEKINVLISKFFDTAGKNDGSPLSELVEQFADEPMYEEEFQQFIKDEMVQEALSDLDIDPSDHGYLFNILDADNCGNVGLDEFVEGLFRLRGFPRRSDTITIDLMVRDVQKKVQQMEEAIVSLLERVPDKAST